MLSGSVVLELCESGALDRNIEACKVALQERRDALIEALGEHLPSADFVVPGGGYFLWADLGEGFDTVELAKKAKEAGAPFIPGTDFMLEGGGTSLRFSFASVPPEFIDEGVARIANSA
jgi:DNA-binding transcriptional MocR family regulator